MQVDRGGAAKGDADDATADIDAAEIDAGRGSENRPDVDARDEAGKADPGPAGVNGAGIDGHAAAGRREDTRTGRRVHVAIGERTIAIVHAAEDDVAGQRKSYYAVLTAADAAAILDVDVLEQ